MKKARLDNGIVAEVLQPLPGFDFYQCFPESVLRACVDCDDSVEPGMHFDGGAFTVPPPAAAVALKAQITTLEASITPRMWREDAIGFTAPMAFGPDDPRTGKTASQYIAWVDAQIRQLRAQLSG